MAGPVPPHPGLAVRAVALHPAPLRVFPGLAELPDLSRDRLRAPPSPRVFPGLAAGPATLLLPSPPRPAPPRLSSLCARRRSQASLSAGVARADAPLLCSGFRAGHACDYRNPTPADLELQEFVSYVCGSAAASVLSAGMFLALSGGGMTQPGARGQWDRRVPRRLFVAKVRIRLPLTGRKHPCRGLTKQNSCF
nr:putative uncharacterized protein DANCR [Pongo abelii]